MNKAIILISTENRQKKLIIQSLMWVLFYRIGLWICPYQWTKKWILDETAEVVSVREDWTVNEIVRVIRSCGRYVPYATCLTQALAARALLYRTGCKAVIRYGVTQIDGSFEAHAWVEADGRIVLGKQPFHYRYAVLKDSRSLV
jgi:hypothetical protein